MRKVIYAMSVSLDGFIETEDGDVSWSCPDEELHLHLNEFDSTIDTHLYGRGLYENMAAYWPTVEENLAAPQFEIEYAQQWKEKKKIVFSRTLNHVDWNSELYKGDITEKVHRLKAQPGLDMSVGGANLAGIFMQLGLIDEYRLYIFPVVLGHGKRMFLEMEDGIKMDLVETRTFGSGVVMLRLECQPLPV